MRPIILGLMLLATSFCLSLDGSTLSFASAHPHFSIDEALDALYYCKAAYCSPHENIANWTCPSCLVHHVNFTAVTVGYNATTDFLSFTGFNPDKNEVVLAFRGTANIKNWIEDADFKLTDYPRCSGCQVLEGMWDTYRSVKDLVMPSLQDLINNYPNARVLVTGHSLGATSALYAAIDVVLDVAPTGTDLLLYTFGETRGGNPKYAKYATTVIPGGRQFRVTHAADPVPHFPPMDWGYLHAPHELWFDNNGDSSWKNCTDSPTYEDPNCSDSVLLPIDFYDHVLYLGHCTDCEKQKDPISGYCSL